MMPSSPMTSGFPTAPMMMMMMLRGTRQLGSSFPVSQKMNYRKTSKKMQPDPGIEPGTSRVRDGDHATRPTELVVHLELRRLPCQRV